MTNKATIRLGAALAFGLLAAPAAMAGGFSRNEADTNILFEDGNIVFRIGGSYVMPGRTYDTIGGRTATMNTPFSQNYFMPSMALKMRLGDYAGCALTYSQPFGGSASYTTETQLIERLSGGPRANPSQTMNFKAHEYGGTCNLKFKAGPGNMYLIGGVFVQSFNYVEETLLGTLSLNDNGRVGYRVGLAYDVPEYAMRAQIMYRSQINHAPKGEFNASVIGQAVGGLPGVPLPSNASGTLPQSVKLSLQSGVAPNWLVYGSLAWTNWKVLDTLNYTIVGIGPKTKVFEYRDGWTAQVGVGHKFNDKLSGTVNVTWDQGVGRIANISTDSWTLGTGLEYQTGFGKLGFGGAVSWLRPGSQSMSGRAPYNATVGNDMAAAVGMSYMFKY